MSTIEIIPTNTCPHNIADLRSRSEQFAAYADQVQLDISDGRFTSIRSWPYGEGQWDELEKMAAGEIELPFRDTIKYETHMMIEDPRECGVLLARVGVSRVMAHVEAFDSNDAARAAIDAWKQAGARETGLALLIDTDFSLVDPIVPALDCVLLMSIATLGAQGATFDERIYERIRTFRAMHPRVVIAVDGGVSAANITELAKAGASRFGVGSAISKAKDQKVAYEDLKKLAESAIE